MILLLLLTSPLLVQANLIQLAADACAGHPAGGIGLYGRFYEVMNGQLQGTICSGTKRQSPPPVIWGAALHCSGFGVPSGAVVFQTCAPPETRTNPPKTDCDGSSDYSLLSAFPVITITGPDFGLREASSDCIGITCKDGDSSNMYFTDNVLCPPCQPPTRKPTKKPTKKPKTKPCKGIKNKKQCKKCIEGLIKKECKGKKRASLKKCVNNFMKKFCKGLKGSKLKACKRKALCIF